MLSPFISKRDLPVKLMPQLGFLSELDERYINRWLEIIVMGFSMVGLSKEPAFGGECMSWGQGRMI